MSLPSLVPSRSVSSPLLSSPLVKSSCAVPSSGWSFLQTVQTHSWTELEARDHTVWCTYSNDSMTTYAHNCRTDDALPQYDNGEFEDNVGRPEAAVICLLRLTLVVFK